MAERVYIFDTTLRDGEQSPGYSMNLEEKIKVAEQLEALGVDIIEAGFAASSLGDAESIKAISKIVKNATVASLSRALKKDIDASYNAVKKAVSPRIHVFLATSDLHLEYKLRLTKEEALERIIESVKYARSLCPDVEFSLEDASRTDMAFMVKVVDAAIKAGAGTINIPDTVGYATPLEIQNMVRTLKERVKNIDKAIISMHNHDDLGLAVANTLAGLKEGARQVECTICGIGERAGNAALEEVVMALKTRNDFYSLETNIKTEQLWKSARILSSITGVKIFPSKAIVGDNAFAHEAGIHQHGMMANRKTYEIMTPESVGVLTTNYVLGKHSGRHAFVKKTEELGFTLTESEIDVYFSEFKKLCDKKKNIADKDIVALIESTEKEEKKTWSLESYVVNSGNYMTSTACIKLKKEGKSYEGLASGTGPVYASIRAIEKITKTPFSLEDYQLSAVTENRDAQGEVFVKISDGERIYRGRGISTDVIEASILACLSAVNKMLDGEKQSISGGRSAVKMTFDNDMLRGHTDKGA